MWHRVFSLLVSILLLTSLSAFGANSTSILYRSSSSQIASLNLVADSSNVPQPQGGFTFDSLPDPEQYSVSNDFVKHASYGWFPQPYSGWCFGLQSVMNFREWDRVDNLRSSSFRSNRFGFNASDPFEDDEESTFKKKFSADNESDDFPSEDYDSDGLFICQNIPWLSCIARLSINYDRSRTRLYALDTTRRFLNEAGSLQAFREVEVLFSNQHSVNLGANVMLPIYGAYLESEAASLHSIYFLSVGMQTAYTFISENTQYSQIATYKDHLRYENGTDTLTSLQAVPLATLNTLRSYLDFSIGWRVGIRGSVQFMTEAYSFIPLHSVLSDAAWHQYRFGIRLSFGYEID